MVAYFALPNKNFRQRMCFPEGAYKWMKHFNCYRLSEWILGLDQPDRSVFLDASAVMMLGSYNKILASEDPIQKSLDEIQKGLKDDPPLRNLTMVTCDPREKLCANCFLVKGDYGTEILIAIAPMKTFWWRTHDYDWYHCGKPNDWYWYDERPGYYPDYIGFEPICAASGLGGGWSIDDILFQARNWATLDQKFKKPWVPPWQTKTGKYWRQYEDGTPKYNPDGTPMRVGPAPNWNPGT